MLMMNRPEWLSIVIACICCIVNGAAQPGFGIILTKVTAVNRGEVLAISTRMIFFFRKVFQECDDEVQKRRVLLYVLLFLAVGLASWIATFFQVCFHWKSTRNS
jgi:hypothetical protein